MSARSRRKKVMAVPHIAGMSVRYFHGLFRPAWLVSTALVFVSAAFAADVKPPPQDQPAGSVPVDSKQVVCKRVRSNDGGMLPGPKVCHTRAEWAALDKEGTDPSAGEPPKDHN
jgi:hypothetical protein